MIWGQNFGTICGIDVGIGIPNFAALRAAVFQLSAKNLRGADTRRISQAVAAAAAMYADGSAFRHQMASRGREL